MENFMFSLFFWGGGGKFCLMGGGLGFGGSAYGQHPPYRSSCPCMCIIYLNCEVPPVVLHCCGDRPSLRVPQLHPGEDGVVGYARVRGGVLGLEEEDGGGEVGGDGGGDAQGIDSEEGWDGHLSRFDLYCGAIVSFSFLAKIIREKLTFQLGFFFSFLNFRNIFQRFSIQMIQ